MSMNLSQAAGAPASITPADRQADHFGTVIADWFARVIANMRAARRRREDLAALAHLSDRELADIGIHRCDFDRIHCTEFAAERAAWSRLPSSFPYC